MCHCVTKRYGGRLRWISLIMMCHFSPSFHLSARRFDFTPLSPIPTQDLVPESLVSSTPSIFRISGPKRFCDIALEPVS